MRTNPRFWPLDDDSEGEIYDSLAWDLPGFRSRRTQPPVRFKRRRPARRTR